VDDQISWVFEARLRPGKRAKLEAVVAELVRAALGEGASFQATLGGFTS
jgi:hypothetical protein